LGGNPNCAHWNPYIPFSRKYFDGNIRLEMFNSKWPFRGYGTSCSFHWRGDENLEIKEK